jgi:hypothetical protein
LTCNVANVWLPADHAAGEVQVVVAAEVPVQARVDMQEIASQLKGVMASLADVEKIASALQADAVASGKVMLKTICTCVMHQVADSAANSTSGIAR